MHRSHRIINTWQISSQWHHSTNTQPIAYYMGTPARDNRQKIRVTRKTQVRRNARPPYEKAISLEQGHPRRIHLQVHFFNRANKKPMYTPCYSTCQQSIRCVYARYLSSRGGFQENGGEKSEPSRRHQDVSYGSRIHTRETNNRFGWKNKQHAVR